MFRYIRKIKAKLNRKFYFRKKNILKNILGQIISRKAF